MIESERFLLRSVVAEDVHDFFELDNDPEVHRYLGNKPVSAIEESKAIIQSILRQYEENGIGRLAIIDKDTGKFLGWSGLKYEKQVRTTPYYDLGYRIKRKYWGQGIATEAARMSLEYGFSSLNLDKICAAAQIENIASNKILTNLGMRWLETFEFDGVNCHWYEIQYRDWSSSE